MKVSVVVATCGRSDMLFAMLNSLSLSTNWIRGNIDLETIFVIDNDTGCYNVAVNFPPYEGKVIDFSWNLRGALNAWNRGLYLSTGDIIVPAGDDQKFYANWLDFALESHKEKLGGYGVLGMNDLAYDGNEQLATMYLIDRKFIKDHLGGVLCPPCYNYYCVDSEVNAKAKMLGRFYWEKQSMVEHLHSAHGKRPVDDTDRLKDDKWVEIDNKTFEERKSQGFPVTWEPVI